MADDPLLSHFRSVAPAVMADPAEQDSLVTHFNSIAPSVAAAAAPAPTAPGVWPATTRIPAMVGSKALEGLASDVDLIGQAGRALVPPAVNDPAMNRVLLQGEIARDNPVAAFTSGRANPGSIVGALRGAGLVDSPVLAPQSPLEQVAGAAVRGGAEAAPALMFGAPAVASLLSGVAGGGAGEATRMMSPKDTPGWVSPAMGAVAGLGVGGALNAVRGSATIPTIARGLGAAETTEGAGVALQTAAKQWIKDTFVGDPARGVLSKVEQIKASVPPIAPTTLTPMTNYSQTVRSLLAGGSGRYGGPGSPLSSRFIEQLDKQLNSIGSDATWSEAEGIQRKIGQLMANPTLDHSADQVEVDALYKALLADRQAVAHANGIGPQFDAANAEIHELYNTRKGVMSKVTKGDDPDHRPGDVASSLMTGGYKQGTDLAVLRSEVPFAVDELASGTLQANPKIWSRLSPEAKEHIVPNPATRAALDAAVPEPSNSLSPATHAIQAMAGGWAGNALAHASAHWGMNPLVAEGLAGLLGFMAPSAYRGAKGLVTNPNAAIQPMLGGRAAGEP